MLVVFACHNAKTVTMYVSALPLHQLVTVLACCLLQVVCRCQDATAGKQLSLSAASPASLPAGWGLYLGVSRILRGLAPMAAGTQSVVISR